MSDLHRPSVASMFVAGTGRVIPESATGWLWQWQSRSRTDSEADQLPAGAAPGLRSKKLARLEAVLFVSDVALSPRRIAQLATLADATEARTLIRHLNDCYDRAGCAFRVEQVAAGYRLLTRPEYAMWLSKLHQRQAELKLTQSALETLAIVAYRQPVTRADLEAVRGVASAEMLKQLLDRGLIKIAGAEETLGRPNLYETTRLFLELFGLRALEDLPMAARLRRIPQEAAPRLSDAA